MYVICCLVSAVIGASLLEFSGVILGLIIGYLLAETLQLRKRISSIEAALPQRQRTTAPQKTAGEKKEVSLEELDLDEKAFVVDAAPKPPASVTKNPTAKARPEQPPAKPTNPNTLSPSVTSPASRLMESIKSLFLGGNMVTRIGVLILFIGVSFLLKYAAQRNIFPIELRLLTVALAGLALLGIGWRLRVKNFMYAVILQGGGVGILYLTLFAAARFYELLPYSLVLIVMSLLVVLSALLAVIQDAKILAILGIIGGFLAPILLASGSDNHVALFSYYAFLNSGILGIAWFKTWRELNLVGFIFTFVIASLWGFKAYTPDKFTSTEPFLLLFFVFYVCIAVLFASRQPPRLKGYVDGTLVFGVPLISFALQFPLVKDFEYGIAWSALGMGVFYALLAWQLMRKKRDSLLGEAFLALGVVFASLAIPFAISGQWTSAAWALEGAAIFWVGMRQERLGVRVFAILLQAGAAFFFLLDFHQRTGVSPIFNPLFLGFLLLSLSAFAISFFSDCLHRENGKKGQAVSIFFLFTGCLWWLFGGLHEIDRFVVFCYEPWVTLFFISMSCITASILATHLNWQRLCYPAMGNLAAIYLIGMSVLLSQNPEHFFIDYGVFAWIAAISIHFTILYREDQRWPQKIIRSQHIAGLWFMIFLLGYESVWGIEHNLHWQQPWPQLSWGLIPAAALWLLLAYGAALSWPIARFKKDYLGHGIALPAACLALWHFVMNFRAEAAAPFSYLPVLNALELSQIFVTVFLLKWLLAQPKIESLWGEREPLRYITYGLFAMSFIWLNASIARAVHVYAEIPYRMNRLWDSFAFQASVSLLWGISALLLTIIAHRRSQRGLWVTGAVLLGLEVAKLFLVDLSGSGSVSRIVSFIAVGCIMMLIGYFAPMPPGEKQLDGEIADS